MALYGMRGTEIGYGATSGVNNVQIGAGAPRCPHAAAVYGLPPFTAGVSVHAAFASVCTATLYGGNTTIYGGNAAVYGGISDVFGRHVRQTSGTKRTTCSCTAWAARGAKTQVRPLAVGACSRAIRSRVIRKEGEKANGSAGVLTAHVRRAQRIARWGTTRGGATRHATALRCPPTFSALSAPQTPPFMPAVPASVYRRTSSASADIT
eukprot:3453616-Rhodomonas_salina.1